MIRPDFANISNVAYIDEIFRRWQLDPSAIDPDWAGFFETFDFEAFLSGNGDNGGPPPRAAAAAPPASPASPAGAAATALPAAATPRTAPAAHAPRTLEPRGRTSVSGPRPEPTIGVFDLVHSYRELGHLIADLDPLGENDTSHPLLELDEFGFDPGDLDRIVDCPSIRGHTGSARRLGDLVDLLRETYCGTLAVEYMYISHKEHREWIQDHIEPSRNRPELSTEDRKRILERLMRAEALERFLHTKFVGQKRFSLEGGETLIPLLDEIIETAGDSGVREVVLGMPHRGRVNALAHTMGKPYEMLLAEFEGSFLPKSIQGDGDVKYHLGYARDMQTAAGNEVHISLLYNPSHLEIINPVAEGIVAAKQHYRHDHERATVMPLLLHGDAAFMGQGVVMETLALSELPYYSTGGTVHVIVNNQVGFTTSPRDYRFGRYPTDIAKLINAPVLHVNGDDPEAAVQAGRLASKFRAEFKEDILIDLVCYRRHGHNELDDPTFTQPLMYRTIAGKRPVHELYRDRLLAGGTIDEAWYKDKDQSIRDELAAALDYARDFMPKQQVFSFGGAWKGMAWAGDNWEADTRVAAGALERVMKSVTTHPEGFHIHPKIRRLMDDRRKQLEDPEGGKIDWGCAEMLALGTLLLEGITVRLSGQDSGRGTFSHRQAAFFDMTTGERFVPLDHMTDNQGRFYLVDSCLSEAGVLGFEWGFASADPRNLVIWEAQFGDFANGAQVIIDQFLVSGESKWQRMNGLVLLLPHGYEGQGPEHSSARLERFLTMCAEQNIQVCNLTTPAQYFHALRRQQHRAFRKPLVLMSPKSMLRHRLCVSRLEEFTETTFRSAIDEVEDLDRSKVRRLLLCSGKVYYDLLMARRDRGIDDIAIARIEQLYPFPTEEVREIIRSYPDDTEVFWVQEEPKNMGAWRFMSDRDFTFFDDDRKLVFVGRASAASPASGSYKIHQAEIADLLDEALKPPRVHAVAPQRNAH